MEQLRKIFFGNYILSVSLLAWLAAQIIKTCINVLLTGKFDAERLWGAGGMPSSHSALVCAMVTATAKSQSVNSPFFAFSLVLAGIVMYDAMGVRRETGEQAKVLNQMIADWISEGNNVLFGGKNGKQLKEKVGHTPFEVIAGAILGVVLGLLIPVM